LEDIYKDIPLEKVPWNRASPPDLLVKFIESGVIKPCKALDIGCGMGNYSIYLAGRGFEVTGVDESETAIRYAISNAEKAGTPCKFLLADFLVEGEEIGNNFGFVFDWEVLHHIYPEFRSYYVKKVADLLAPQAYYLSVCFNEKDPCFGGTGKYRKTSIGTILYFSSVEELRELFDPYFNIIELKIVSVEGSPANHSANWALLQKK
jgi:2-polyprenyl-3-methyl-5-hydroxy-6-metoxy-1,4-benzoquinol methylase